MNPEADTTPGNDLGRRRFVEVDVEVDVDHRLRYDGSMNRLKLLLGDVASAAFTPVAWLRPPACRVLVYHAVGSDVPGDRGRIYSLSPERFARHVRLLVSMASETAELTDGVRAGRGLVVTFDDGYRDTLTIAAPQLVSAGLPFTVFVTPDFVAHRAPPYLSRQELRELAALPGVTIGAHGRTHRRLTECTDGELAAELTGARAWLEDIVARPVLTMSYPHGAVDTRVRDAAGAAGYITAACSKFGAHRPGDDALMVPRTDMWADDGPRRLAAKVHGRWDWMSLRA